MKFSRRRFLDLAAGALALPTVPPIARAQVYPNRPVRVVVGFTAGGVVDVFARLRPTAGRALTELDPMSPAERLAQLCRLLCGQTTKGESGMYRQRNFLAMVTLAATAATTPAWGQTAGPAAVAANGGAQSAGPIPDFSGIWAHASLPGFEPPSSGPGPVTNRLRLRGGPQNGRSNPNQLVGDYSNPILKPEAAEAVKKHGEISLAGVAYPTPSNQCWPESVPYIFWNFGMQMLQQPHQLTILYDQDHEVRHVRMNELHPARVVPSWYGDSVGHYEGEALIIDTVGIKARRPFATVDAFGTPYTEALHVVERYRLLDYEAAKEGLERDLKENFQVVGGTFFNDPNYRGKHLQLEFTVEDAGVFTASWSATITYRRGFNSFGRDEWSEVVCSENPHEYYSGKDTAVPHADKPDF